MSTPTITQFNFKLTHPVLYAQNIVVQAADYAEAAGYAQAHCTGTLWTIAQARNLATGEVVSNG
jgi:hypothetical protein